MATLAGLILLLAGGIRLLRRAFFLAGEADEPARAGGPLECADRDCARVERPGQGGLHPQPADRLCQRRPARRDRRELLHRQRGRPARPTAPTACPGFTRQVDDAGEGLHVSVCFAEGRGDQHDHHALDLMLGHLSALWRTVLRQEALERAAGHDALTGLPNRRLFEAS